MHPTTARFSGRLSCMLPQPRMPPPAPPIATHAPHLPCMPPSPHMPIPLTCMPSPVEKNDKHSQELVTRVSTEVFTQDVMKMMSLSLSSLLISCFIVSSCKVTVVVTFGFVPRNFGRWWEPMNSTFSL